MSLLFKGKVIIITGAASGIGRATAIHLSSLGATLSLTDINATGLLETLSLCSPPPPSSSGTAQPQHTTITLNISVSASCTTLITNTLRSHGYINHVLNCAGINPTPLTTAEITDEYWDKILSTNLKSMFAVSRAAIPYLMKEEGKEVQENERSSNTIVNISSTLGLHARPGFAVYCASKFGVVGFSKALALELGDKGVRVNVVAPGYIDTPTNAGVVAGNETVKRLEGEVSLGRFGRGEEVAKVVAFLMSEESSYMTGAVVEVDGGLGRGSI